MSRTRLDPLDRREFLQVGVAASTVAASLTRGVASAHDARPSQNKPSWTSCTTRFLPPDRRCAPTATIDAQWPPAPGHGSATSPAHTDHEDDGIRGWARECYAEVAERCATGRAPTSTLPATPATTKSISPRSFPMSTGSAVEANSTAGAIGDARMRYWLSRSQRRRRPTIKNDCLATVRNVG